ncbi:hypothetical protein [Aeromonas salmonicida]|uniref:hypothetical protein n=1 Tax=Aeromonas salmonicida TaxID=645 RepID=UPI003F7B5FCC
MNNVKIKNKSFILWLITSLMVSQSVHSNILVPEISDGKSYLIDIDKNGVREKIITEENGELLYIISPSGKGSVKGSNLTVDGYSVFDRVTELPNNEKGFLIINRGGNFGAYIINTVSLVNGKYVLTKVSAESENNIDGILFSKVNCELRLSIPFENISPSDVKQVLLSPDESDFSKQCHETKKSYFMLAELESLTKSGKISWTTQAAEYFINNEKITKDNVVTYNNIAYYIFESSKKNPTSLYFLDEILHQFPERAVAHLNKADYLAANFKCRKAKESYDKYIFLMTRNGKESRIPKRVIDYQSKDECQ